MKVIAAFSILIAVLAVFIQCQTDHHQKAQHYVWPLTDSVDGYIKAHEKNRRFSGNMLIAKGDTILYQKSFGVADRNFNIPNTDSTKFLIGSITKPFTAYAILLLEKQGRLSLDNPLSRYFPEFPKAEIVTIRQLLTHTSGIRDYHAFDDWKADSKRDITPHFTIEKVVTDPYKFEPGEKFSYTNTGYILLGLIIEQVSGRSFSEFIQSTILEPLKLEHTGVMNNKMIVENLAEGYHTNLRETTKAPYINYNQPYASGNMYSTTTDLWKFMKAVMNSELIDEEKTKEIFADNTGSYGYGWGIRNFNGTKAFGHRGGMNGFIGAMTYMLEGKYFICYLTNDDNTPKYSITADIVAMLRGEKVEMPEKRKLIIIPDEMKQSVVGDYLVHPGDTLKVFTENRFLYMQESGQVKHELFPVGAYEFAFTLFDHTALFSDLKAGKTQTLQFTGKSKLVAKRVVSRKE